VGPRAGLDTVKKRKIPSMQLPGLNPGRLARSLVSILSVLPR